MLRTPHVLAALGAAMLFACAGPRGSEPAAEAAGETHAEPAAAPEAEQTDAARESAPADYLAEGVVIVDPFGGEAAGPAKLTLGKVVTEASDATKGQYEIELTVGSPDWSKGSKIWTEHVILASHPATAEDIHIGDLVIFNYWNPSDATESRGGPWILGVVKSTDDMFKKQVGLLSLHTNKLESVYLHNIRIADNPKLAAPAQ